MKIKFTALLCLALATVAVFASCDEDQSGAAGGGGHTHTYSDTFTSSKTHHWYQATCEHGENKKDYAEHADVNEDGKCDVCAYEVGHEHAFADEWQSDENNHWKNAVCTHKSEIGELDAHSDANQDGSCDVCEAHVHTYNVFKFCSVCDEQEPGGAIDENVLGSVVYAAAYRKNKIVSGNIEYRNISNNVSENRVASIIHDVAFAQGTNGLYMERSYLDSDENELVQKDWITRLANGDATGVTSITQNGVLTSAQPSSFGPDSLLGYYYTVSTLADGHGAEAVLKSLYEASQAATPDAPFDKDRVVVENFVVNHDPDANKYDFSFNTLVVHVTSTGQGDQDEIIVYNANYYEVEVSFTYNDDYALTSFYVSCDCYTNDAGASTEMDNDFEYDHTTGEMIRNESFVPDNYTITVTQVAGERTEIELNDGSEFTPTDFDIIYDEAETDNVALNVGENTALIIVPATEGTFISFVKNDLKVTVTKKDGTELRGFSANLHGFDAVNMYPTAPGEYVITITYKDIVKNINITVTGEELGGEKTFTFTSTDNNAWNQPYEFVATERGNYTFYLPYGVGVAEYTDLDQYGDPYIDAEGLIFDYVDDPTGREGTVSFTKSLRAGQKVKFCFKCRENGVTYTIGYDEP